MTVRYLRLFTASSKVIKETAVFEKEEDDWKLLESKSNWDRDQLQEVAS